MCKISGLFKPLFFCSETCARWVGLPRLILLFEWFSRELLWIYSLLIWLAEATPSIHDRSCVFSNDFSTGKVLFAVCSMLHQQKFAINLDANAKCRKKLHKHTPKRNVLHINFMSHHKSCVHTKNTHRTGDFDPPLSTCFYFLRHTSSSVILQSGTEREREKDGRRRIRRREKTLIYIRGDDRLADSARANCKRIRRKD